jgi:hypothetical protein
VSLYASSPEGNSYEDGNMSEQEVRGEPFPCPACTGVILTMLIELAPPGNRNSPRRIRISNNAVSRPLRNPHGEYVVFRGG